MEATCRGAGVGKSLAVAHHWLRLVLWGPQAGAQPLRPCMGMHAAMDARAHRLVRLPQASN